MSASSEAVTLTWLGQSGFLLRAVGLTIACDLYLSDYCRQRSKLDHTRLTPIPVQPDALTGIDLYLITHAHIDHFDPLTVGPVAAVNPQARFFCPTSGKKVIDEFLADCPQRFEFVSSMQTYELAPGVRLCPVPAAHEELERGPDGEYVALSYLLLLDATRQAIFFAGDTIPYSQQAELIGQHLPQGYALTMALPVNGRDARRGALGFKGNLTLDEAAALSQACAARLLVPCHFGMFALNDIPQPLTADYFTAAGITAQIPQIMQPIPCAQA